MKRPIIIAFITLIYLSGCGGRHYAYVLSTVEPSAKVKRSYALLYDSKRPENIHIEVHKVLASRGFVDRQEVIELEEELQKLSEEEREKVIMKPHIQEMLKKNHDAGYPSSCLIFLGYKLDHFEEQEYRVSGSIQRRGIDIFKGTMLEGSGTDYFSATIKPYMKKTYYSVIKLHAFDISPECPISYDERSQLYKPSFKCPLWWTNGGTDYSGDLRRDILFLLGVIEPYIATNTGSVIIKNFNNNERKALEIRLLKNEKK